jgi:hypothetical protein
MKLKNKREGDKWENDVGRGEEKYKEVKKKGR